MSCLGIFLMSLLSNIFLSNELAFNFSRIGILVGPFGSDTLNGTFCEFHLYRLPDNWLESSNQSFSWETWNFHLEILTRASSYPSCARKWRASKTSWHYQTRAGALKELFSKSLSEGSFWGNLFVGWLLCCTDNISVVWSFRSKWCDCCCCMCSPDRVCNKILLQPPKGNVPPCSSQQFQDGIHLWSLHWCF